MAWPVCKDPTDSGAGGGAGLKERGRTRRGARTGAAGSRPPPARPGEVGAALKSRRRGSLGTAVGASTRSGREGASEAKLLGTESSSARAPRRPSASSGSPPEWGPLRSGLGAAGTHRSLGGRAGGVSPLLLRSLAFLFFCNTHSHTHIQRGPPRSELESLAPSHHVPV